MLMFALVLAIVSVWLELRIIKLVPAIALMNKRVPLFGVAFSLFLSYFIGTMFGAAGMTVLLAGVLSTFVAEPVRRWRSATGESLARINKINSNVKTASVWAKESEETYHYILIGIKWLFVLLFSPLWIPVLIHRNKKMGLTLSDNIKEFKSNSKSRKIAA